MNHAVSRIKLTEKNIYIGEKKLILQKKKLKDHLQYYPSVNKHGLKTMKKQWSLLVICKILNVPNLRSCQRKTERKTFSNLTTAEN